MVFEGIFKSCFCDELLFFFLSIVGKLRGDFMGE